MQGSVENQSRRLLDILCLKGEHGYQVFVETLDEDNKYPWLATRLRRAREGIREEYVYTRNVSEVEMTVVARFCRAPFFERTVDACKYSFWALPSCCLCV